MHVLQMLLLVLLVSSVYGKHRKNPELNQCVSDCLHKYPRSLKNTYDKHKGCYEWCRMALTHNLKSLYGQV
ncbi:unnamed protein product [Cylicocyclus nassatus]|uniref:Uncharacterized protein n=1 Tax=Cylicocyclus nassatus TaxID=53992 RepID=A0AA36M6L6_CYLNA|nr:unnamed protein product [Cylicocyclus nassatus]